MTGAQMSPEPSTTRGQALLADLIAERFPTAAQIRAEARRPTPPPPLITRSRQPITVDTLARDARDAPVFQTRRQAADIRRVEARIAAARRLTAAARRKAAG